MKGKRYGQEQIIYALKRVEGGAKGTEVCRELGVSEATFYLWKKKYGGMGVGGQQGQHTEQQQAEQSFHRGLQLGRCFIRTQPNSNPLERKRLGKLRTGGARSCG